MKHLSCNYIQFEILGLSFCLPLTLVIFTWEVQEKCNMHLYPVWCRSSKSLYCSLFLFFYIYIIHRKFKRGQNQVPKIVRVLGNKTNPKIIKMKNNYCNKWRNLLIQNLLIQPCFKICCFHWKSGSSNGLVDSTYSVAALRTIVLAFVSNKLLPKRRVFIKTGLQRYRKLLSMFSMVLRRVRLSVIYVGQEEYSAQFI